MTELTEGQWQLDDGPVLDRRRGPYILRPPTIDEDTATQDQPVDRADGRRFGRDFIRGYTINLDLTVSGTEDTVLDLYGTLESHWRRRAIRQTPGEVSVLRYNVAGHQRRIYGRPRKFTPNFDLSYQGVISVTATFDTADALFYEDALEQQAVTLVPPSGGGVVSPVVSPVTTVAESTRQGDITVSATEPTWLVVQINGPITNPTIEVLGQWSATLNMSLASDDYVVIDPRPWSRGVLTRFGVNAAGKLTYDSPILSDFTVPPGPSTVVLRGTDATGTASMTVQWRGAYSSL